MGNGAQEENGIGRGAFDSGVYSKGKNAPNSEDLLDGFEPGKRTEPVCISSGRGSFMESMATSLWSWLVVGILCAWFTLWLVEALGRIGARVP